MRLLHHLVRHSSGTFHFRLVVPADLRDCLALRVIKRSLRTRDPHLALVEALHLSAGYARVFAQLRGSSMARGKFDVDEFLRSAAPEQVSHYRIDAERGVVETDGSEAEHARALETLRALSQVGRVPSELVAPAKALSPPVGGKTLRETITYWETVDKSAMRLASTADAFQTAIDDFAAYVGEKRPVAELRKADVASWIAHLRGTKKNKQSTAKRLAGHVKALFESAQRAGFYPDDLTNPANKAVKFNKKDQDRQAQTHGWQAFSVDQLKTIFDPKNLARTREIHTRRAMVIALYTGARVGEIAQMRVAGFREIDGQPVMTIEGELKTDASQRVLPIHPDLVRLGLLDWVSDQSRRGMTRLLPTVKLDGKSGKGNAISKGFSNLLNALQITPRIDPDLAKTVELDPKIGMHSFRDTLIQALQGHADEELRKAYVGHTYEGSRSRKDQMKSSHEVAYMRAWTPAEVAQVLKGIRWSEWLDVDALKPLLDQSDAAHLKVMKALERRERLATRKATREN